MLTAAAFFVLLGVLITVHELGHFLVAKACGVRVLQFSIGFGPRLLGFTRGDTEYRIGILPLGGYVRMYGDDPTQEVPAEERRRAFLEQPYFKKIAISVAGPVANLVLPVVLLFAMFVGTEKVAEPIVGTAMTGEAAALAGLQSGDRVVAVDGKPVSLFTELQEYVEPRGGVPITFTIERGHGQNASERTRSDVVVTPKATPAPTIFDRERTVGRLGILVAKELPIVAVLVGGPAAGAGVQAGDVVDKVDGVAVTTKTELFDALDAAAAKGAVTLDVTRTVPPDAKAPEGTKPTEQKLTLTVAMPSDGVLTGQRVERFGVTAEEMAPGPVADLVARTGVVLREQQEAAHRRFGLFSVDGRVAHVEPDTVAAERGLATDEHVVVAVDGKPLRTPQDLSNAFDATPDAVHAIGVVGPDGARVIAFRMLPHPRRELGGMKVFGVALTSAWGDGATIERTVGPVEAVQRAVRGTGNLVVDVVRGFGLLFTGKVGIESLGGPITIAKMSGQAAQVGADVFIQLMGLISVNLAIINLLPVPVLDGGHIMIFSIEAITRRKMSLETRMKITKVGIALVGLLMIIAIGNDVLGLF